MDYSRIPWGGGASRGLEFGSGTILRREPDKHLHHPLKGHVGSHYQDKRFSG